MEITVAHKSGVGWWFRVFVTREQDWSGTARSMGDAWRQARAVYARHVRTDNEEPVVTPHEMAMKMLAVKHGREERDRAWADAERHLRLAEECDGQRHRCASIAASEHSSDELRVACGRKAPLYRALYVAHLRLAKELARDSGVDVDGLEIPNE